jgi:hypothetical protein
VYTYLITPKQEIDMKDEKHLVVRVHTYDDYCNGAAVAFIPMSVKEDVEKYQEILEEAKKIKGVKPHSMTQFDYRPIWVETLPPVTPEFAKSLFCMESDIDYIEDLIECSDYDGEPVNSIEELEKWVNDEDLRVECGQLFVDSYDFHFDGYIKHSNVHMETEGIKLDTIKPFSKIINETEEA